MMEGDVYGVFGDEFDSPSASTYEYKRCLLIPPIVESDAHLYIMIEIRSPSSPNQSKGRTQSRETMMNSCDDGHAAQEESG